MTPEELAALDLVQGTLLSVEWLDINEDPVGSPTVADLAVRTTYTLFWAAQDSYGIPCIVTTNTIDSASEHQQGWCCTPLACVSRIEVIRRPRKPRQRKPKETPA